MNNALMTPSFIVVLLRERYTKSSAFEIATRQAFEIAMTDGMWLRP